MRYNSIFIKFALIFIIVVVQSCENSPVIEEKKLVKIYAEMIFMQDTSSLSQSAIREKVLKKFKVDENDYSKSINYYNNNPEKWPKFFDEVTAYIEKLKPKPKKIDEKSLPKQSLSVDKKNL
jgi:hypothetical protein